MLIGFSGSSSSTLTIASDLAARHGVEESDIVLRKDNKNNNYMNEELLDATMDWIDYYI